VVVSLTLAVATLVALVSMWGLSARAPTSSTGVLPSRPTPSPPRQPFVFPAPTVIAVTVAKTSGAKDAAQAVASTVQGTLNRFYDLAFMDPRTWRAGVPAGAWEAFDPAVRARAQADAASLGLGKADAPIATLQVTQAALTIQVLFNASGHPQSAQAAVMFQAAGRLANGQPIEVTNAATFILRRVSSTWLISGYPAANTQVTSPPPIPIPGPSPVPGPTASGATP
jgi:hypothetical protein